MMIYVKNEDGGKDYAISIEDLTDLLMDNINSNAPKDIEIKKEDVIAYATAFVEDNDGLVFDQEMVNNILDDGTRALVIYSQINPYDFYYNYFCESDEI